MVNELLRVPVPLAVPEWLGVWELDGVTTWLALSVALCVTVCEREGLCEAVCVTEGERDGEGVCVSLGVEDGEGVGEADGVSVTDGVGLGLGVRVGLGVLACDELSVMLPEPEGVALRLAVGEPLRVTVRVAL